MPYSMNWLIENEIIYTRYYGVVTTEELRDCLVKMRDLMESSARPLVHSISDMGDVTEAVQLRDSLPIVREIGQPKHSGWILSIREKSVIIKMIGALGSSLFKLRYRSFGTLDEAVALLKEMDQTISWDKVNPAVTAHLTGDEGMNLAS